jgi:hypothetical protein
MGVEATPGQFGRIFAPHPGDDGFGGDHPAGIDRQCRQYSASLGWTGFDSSPIGDYQHWPQQPDLRHCGSESGDNIPTTS